MEEEQTAEGSEEEEGEELAERSLDDAESAGLAEGSEDEQEVGDVHGYYDEDEEEDEGYDGVGDYNDAWNGMPGAQQRVLPPPSWHRSAPSGGATEDTAIVLDDSDDDEEEEPSSQPLPTQDNAYSSEQYDEEEDEDELEEDEEQPGLAGAAVRDASSPLNDDYEEAFRRPTGQGLVPPPPMSFTQHDGFKHFARSGAARAQLDAADRIPFEESDIESSPPPEAAAQTNAAFALDPSLDPSLGQAFDPAFGDPAVFAPPPLPEVPAGEVAAIPDSSPRQEEPAPLPPPTAAPAPTLAPPAQDGAALLNLKALVNAALDEPPADSQRSVLNSPAPAAEPASAPLSQAAEDVPPPPSDAPMEVDAAVVDPAHIESGAELLAVKEATMASSAPADSLLAAPGSVAPTNAAQTPDLPGTPRGVDPAHVANAAELIALKNKALQAGPRAPSVLTAPPTPTVRTPASQLRQDPMQEAGADAASAEKSEVQAPAKAAGPEDDATKWGDLSEAITNAMAPVSDFLTSALPQPDQASSAASNEEVAEDRAPSPAEAPKTEAERGDQAAPQEVLPEAAPTEPEQSERGSLPGFVERIVAPVSEALQDAIPASLLPVAPSAAADAMEEDTEDVRPPEQLPEAAQPAEEAKSDGTSEQPGSLPGLIEQAVAPIAEALKDALPSSLLPGVPQEEVVSSESGAHAVEAAEAKPSEPASQAGLPDERQSESSAAEDAGRMPPAIDQASEQVAPSDSNEDGGSSNSQSHSLPAFIEKAVGPVSEALKSAIPSSLAPQLPEAEATTTTDGSASKDTPAQDAAGDDYFDFDAGSADAPPSDDNAHASAGDVIEEDEQEQEHPAHKATGALNGNSSIEQPMVVDVAAKTEQAAQEAGPAETPESPVAEKGSSKLPRNRLRPKSQPHQRNRKASCQMYRATTRSNRPSYPAQKLASIIITTCAQPQPAPQPWITTGRERDRSE